MSSSDDSVEILQKNKKRKEPHLSKRQRLTALAFTFSQKVKIDTPFDACLNQ